MCSFLYQSSKAQSSKVQSSYLEAGNNFRGLWIIGSFFAVSLTLPSSAASFFVFIFPPPFLVQPNHSYCRQSASIEYLVNLGISLLGGQ